MGWQNIYLVIHPPAEASSTEEKEAEREQNNVLVCSTTKKKKKEKKEETWYLIESFACLNACHAQEEKKDDALSLSLFHASSLRLVSWREWRQMIRQRRWDRDGWISFSVSLPRLSSIFNKETFLSPGRLQHDDERDDEEKMLFSNLDRKPDNNSMIAVERISISTTVQTDCHSSSSEQK